MKLITFKHLGQTRIGAIVNENQGVDFSKLEEAVPPHDAGIDQESPTVFTKSQTSSFSPNDIKPFQPFRSGGPKPTS